MFGRRGKEVGDGAAKAVRSVSGEELFAFFIKLQAPPGAVNGDRAGIVVHQADHRHPCAQIL
jgi:hypothetical protein